MARCTSVLVLLFAGALFAGDVMVTRTETPDKAVANRTNTAHVRQATVSGPGANAYSRIVVDVDNGGDNSSGQSLTNPVSSGTTQVVYTANDGQSHVGQFHACAKGRAYVNLFGVPDRNGNVRGSGTATVHYVLVRNVDGVETVVAEKEASVSQTLSSSDSHKISLANAEQNFLDELNDAAKFNRSLSFTLTFTAQTSADYAASPHYIGDCYAKLSQECPTEEKDSDKTPQSSDQHSDQPPDTHGGGDGGGGVEEPPVVIPPAS